MTLPPEWAVGLVVFGGTCALTVVVLSLTTGEPWLFVLAVVAPVAGYFMSQENDLGVLLLAGWAFGILVTMLTLRRRARLRPRVRKSHSGVADA